MSDDELNEWIHTMTVEETTITTAGVMRCCLTTVATEYETVSEGMHSTCPHCKTEFELVNELRRGWIWIPLWQLKNQEAA